MPRERMYLHIPAELDNYRNRPPVEAFVDRQCKAEGTKRAGPLKFDYIAEGPIVWFDAETGV